jgi:hypothetical protein
MSTYRTPLRAQVLGVGDARMSYVLASLSQPALTLTAWTRMLKRTSKIGSKTLLLGVFNPTGVVVALVAAAAGELTPIAHSHLILGGMADVEAAARLAIEARRVEA